MTCWLTGVLCVLDVLGVLACLTCLRALRARMLTCLECLACSEYLIKQRGWRASKNCVLGVLKSDKILS